MKIEPNKQKIDLMINSSLTTGELLHKAQKLIVRGNFSESESILQDLVKQEPGNAAVHFRLGVSLQRQKRLDPALAEYRKAIELNPGMPEPYNRIGPILEGRDSPEEVLAFYAEAIKSNPSNYSARLKAALLLRKLDRIEEAQKLYDEAMESQLTQNITNRTTISQRFIELIDAQNYLEIGVARGINFHQISVPRKVAVDPVFRIPGTYGDDSGKTYFETYSDNFFENFADYALDGGLGVAFIDGLHTYEQSLRDILNSVEHLLPNGAVVIHDCNPTSKAAAHPVQSEARTMPGFTGAWMGDVFKSILWLRANRPDLDVTVLNCDCGVGIVQKRKATSPRLAMSDREINTFSYEKLAADRENLLNLRSPDQLDSLSKI